MNRLATAGWRWLIASLALAILTTACGSNAAPAPASAGSHPATLNVELDWVPNPDHVGFYYAQHQGYFTRQHLTVNFRVPSSAADPLKLVGLGKADLAAWRDFGNWLKAHKLVHDTPDAAAVMTGRYLPHPSCPGQGGA